MPAQSCMSNKVTAGPGRVLSPNCQVILSHSAAAGHCVKKDILNSCTNVYFMHKCFIPISLFQGDSGINGYPAIPGEKVYMFVVFHCHFVVQMMSKKEVILVYRADSENRRLIMIGILIAFT